MTARLAVETTDLDGVLLLRPRSFTDERGSFSEIFNEADLREAGIDARFVQDNLSFSKEKGTIRGLHFQLFPYAQAKLVRVLDGAILDVAVDIRPDSAKFGHHITARLDAEQGGWIYIPVGFAHGFCTLAEGTRVLYKVTAHYAPEFDRGILWSDPGLGIDWPVLPDRALLSAKDRILPMLAAMQDELPFCRVEARRPAPHA